jgi:trk system potassium uptake protein TrkA
MKFAVIGLGRLGYHVASVLAENGMEVLGVDSNESIVASIRDQVTQAICMRITDEASLRSIGVDEMDTVIVAMGENFAQSILVTALLKKHLKVPTVITRAINDIHKEILDLVGADRVILPEKEIGIKLANNLSSPFMDLARLSKDFSISQIAAAQEFVGKKVGELNLNERYKVHCIGTRIGEEIAPVDQHYVIQKNTKLILAGNNDDLERISKL